MSCAREGHQPEFRLFANSDELVAAAAEAIVDTLYFALDRQSTASVVLTGGRVAGSVLGRLPQEARAAGIDWDRLHWWWGDERFLPSQHPDRNETQARSTLLDHLGVTEAHVHPMPASDGPAGDDVGRARLDYEAELDAYLGAGGPGPRKGFDLVLLSIGEDGHVASLFPGHPALDSPTLVAAVTDAPKPPPVRLTHTLQALNSANRVFLLASGPEKAGSVHQVLGGSHDELPAARVRGRDRTVWFIDRAAASKLLADEGSGGGR